MTEIELWTHKYTPKKIEDIIGQESAVRQICNWLNKDKKDRDKCLLISGPSGIGKTSGSICILENYGYKVYEFNASDVRTKNQMQASLHDLIHMRQVSGNQNIAIIIDELDGISGGDKGGLSEIIHYINPNRGKGNQKRENKVKGKILPTMICICNNIMDRKLYDFRKDCVDIKFNKPNEDNLKQLLHKICHYESVRLDENAIELVIDYSQHDYRRLINYLQSIDSLIIDNEYVLGIEEIEQCNSVIGEKTYDMGLEEGVIHALSNDDFSINDYLNIYNNHKSQYICSIYENYVSMLMNTKLDPLDKISNMKQIMEDIAWSDMIDKTMHKNQLWYLHRIHGLLSCYLPTAQLRCQNPILNISSSRSKFNQQKNNEKDIHNLSSNIKSVVGTTDVHVLSEIVLHYLLDKSGRVDDNLEIVKNILENYGLDHTHIKTLIKIDRLTTHQKYHL